MDNVEKLNKLLEVHKLNAKVINRVVGPTFTRYEVGVDPFSFRMEKFHALEENIAHLLQLTEPPIMFPIYERSIVAIDALNRERKSVYLSSVLADIETRDIEGMNLPVVLGYTVYGSSFVVDLADTPHMLVAGTTGSGKSVGLRSIITSLLHFSRETEVILIDPKAVELNIFEEVGVGEVVSDKRSAVVALDYVMYQVGDRYARLKRQGAHNIREMKDMRYLVVVIDELADLFQTSKQAKEIVLQIVQKSRAAGIHVIAATQRPSVDIISGVIKTNFPARVAFKVSSHQDSQTIIGGVGAEKLLGQGDMLYRKSAGSCERVQCGFVTDNDIVRILGRR